MAASITLTTGTGNLRDRVKDLLGILTSVTTFDADIDLYVLDSINNLWPLVKLELAPVTTPVVASDGRTIAMPAGTFDVSRLEVSDGAYLQETDDYWIHGTNILLIDLVTAGRATKLWGYGKYSVHASNPALTTLEENMVTTVIYWACSIFYASVAGDRRKYNAYITAGGAADRDARDAVNDFLQLGDDHLDKRYAVRSS